jgi:hypothetical protein
MKKFGLLMAVIAAGVITLALTTRNAGQSDEFINGTPEIRSISALAFNPDGLLFIGDSKSATIFAIDLKDGARIEKSPAIEIKNIDQKIAALLGTQPQNLSILDVAVNPASKNVYCAVQSGDGTPLLFKVAGDKIEAVSLKDVAYTSVTLNNAPAEDAKDQRGRPLRVSSISDLGFYDGKVMVSGLSNQQFSSTFRIIPFPFGKQQDQSSLEIYHAAHAQYETAAPIRTFTIGEVSGKKYLIASYTCTPLVLFPLDELKPGTHVKGRTVGEFGAGNSPLDMISMKKGDETMLLMANSSRPVFRVKMKNIETYQGSLTTPVEENFATAGVNFVQLPVTNVLQLDKLDDKQIIVLQRRNNGDLDLWTANDRWL